MGFCSVARLYCIKWIHSRQKNTFTRMAHTLVVMCADGYLWTHCWFHRGIKKWKYSVVMSIRFMGACLENLNFYVMLVLHVRCGYMATIDFGRITAISATLSLLSWGCPEKLQKKI